MLRTLAFVLTVGIPSIAVADAVPPPPRDCPPGAVGETGHNGEWCRPTTCNTDTDCADFRDERKRTCQVQGLCVEERNEKSQSGWSHDQPITRVFGHAACKAGDACTLGQCVEAKRCVLVAEPAPKPEPPIDVSPKPEPKPEPTVTKAPEPVTSESAAPAKKGCAGGGADTSAWLGLALVAVALKRPAASRH